MMKRGGLGILIILIVALLIAFLVSAQMMGTKSVSAGTAEQNALDTVQSAQNAVDALNTAMQNSIGTDLP